jgi:hypothetical protein
MSNATLKVTKYGYLNSLDGYELTHTEITGEEQKEITRKTYIISSHSVIKRDHFLSVLDGDNTKLFINSIDEVLFDKELVIRLTIEKL